MFLFVLLAAALLTMALFPETPTARTLRRWLVQAPAAGLSRFGVGRAILLVFLALVGLILFLLGGMEGVRLFAMAAPEALTWMLMFDAGVALDLFALAFIAIRPERLNLMREQLRRSVGDRAKGVVRLARRAGRAVRSTARRRPSTRRDDAEPRGFGIRGFGVELQPAFG